MLTLLTFVIARTMIIAAAIAAGYFVVNQLVEPYALRPTCLTDTNSCVEMTLYKLQNSFFAQVFPSGLYMWLNGSTLYVYGQAPGTCTDDKNYEVVDKIDISGTNENPIFTRQNYECITNASAVQEWYTQRVKPQTIYLRGISKTQTANLNVFEIMMRLIDFGYISVSNLGKTS